LEKGFDSSSNCITIKIKDFSMLHTFESAQPLTFYADYNKDKNTIKYASASGKLAMLVDLKEDGNTATMSAYGSDGEALYSELKTRFRLKDNMQKIYKSIDKDENISKAISRYRGMRLTINDPWETTLCFIISQFNNVKRIRLIVKNIVDRFGSALECSDGSVINTFPTSRQIMQATDAELRRLGTGFRSKYITSAAEFCTNNMDLYKLSPNNYEKLKSRLMEIDGVGEKVADCIALMGYGNLNAFPTDVWIKRTMEKLYFDGKKTRLFDIHEFAKDYWGKYAGYAQQYLFHDARTSKAKR